MSNTFKSVSRFASLLDINDETTNNYDTKVKNKDNTFLNRNTKLDNGMFRQKNENRRDNIKPVNKTIVNMDISNFPELVQVKNKKEELNKMNFLNKVIKEDGEKNNEEINNNNDEKQSNELDIEYMNLKPGWSLLKRDKLTGKTIIKHKPTERTLRELERNKINEREKSEKEIVYDVFKRLAEIYEERTKEYIELWGYDEWEKMHRFPNYDYEYFDKLDQKYEEEMAELESNETTLSYLNEICQEQDYI